MITVELTEDHIELLTEGALRYGRCSMLIRSAEGDDIVVALIGAHRRGRPVKPRTALNAPAAPNGPAGETQ